MVMAERDPEPSVEAPPMVPSLPAGPAVPAQMRRRSFPSAAPTLEWQATVPVAATT